MPIFPTVRKRRRSQRSFSLRCPCPSWTPLMIMKIARTIHQRVVPIARGPPVVNSTPISLQNVIIIKFTTKRSEVYAKITRRNDGRSTFSFFCISRLTESARKNPMIANTHFMKYQFSNIPPPIQKCSLSAT